MKKGKTVRVSVRLDAKTARQLKALALADTPPPHTRTVANALAWLGRQAVHLGTINPLVPLARLNETLGDAGKKWRVA